MKHKSIKVSLWLPILIISLITVAIQPLRAETITIGKGTGIVWEGLPFNQTINGVINGISTTSTIFGLVSIGIPINGCGDQKLKFFGGYEALPFVNGSGIGIVPRATFTSSYYLVDGTLEVMNGTIGLPKTIGRTSSGYEVTDRSSHYQTIWCLSPRNTDVAGDFYKLGSRRTINISGDWVIVADGTQKSSQLTYPYFMYFGSFAGDSSSKVAIPIFPKVLTLRVSTLECTVNTPTTIDFGKVMRNTVAGSTLAVQLSPLITTCGQSSDFINANINLQFRALSGFYENTPSRLALSQGGGYITGEIGNGVTESGECNKTTGVTFDAKPLKVGFISAGQSSTTNSNYVIWRLCSGGAKLPSGAVNAYADMQVTFN